VNLIPLKRWCMECADRLHEKPITVYRRLARSGFAGLTLHRKNARVVLVECREPWVYDDTIGVRDMTEFENLLGFLKMMRVENRDRVAIAFMERLSSSPSDQITACLRDELNRFGIQARKPKRKHDGN